MRFVAMIYKERKRMSVGESDGHGASLNRWWGPVEAGLALWEWRLRRRIPPETGFWTERNRRT